MFAYFGWQYILYNHGDAKKYWFVGQNLSMISWLDYVKPGTEFIQFLTFPFVKYLHFPFWSGFFLFSCISFLGVYRLWKILEDSASHHFKFLLFGSFILLLPNAHFWTSLIGKESILFLALSLIAEGLYYRKVKTFKFILGLLLVILIRPHVAGVIIFSAIIALLLTANWDWKKKALALGIGFLTLCIIAVVLQNVAKGEGSLFQKITYLYDAHNVALRHTNAYVPLETYNLPYKLFTFYFRPLPWECSGFYAQCSAWQNVLVLLVSLLVVYFLIKSFKSIRREFYFVFTIVFIFVFALMYVYAYANYGLIARTKVMMLPFTFLLMIKAINGLQKNKH